MGSEHRQAGKREEQGGRVVREKVKAPVPGEVSGGKGKGPHWSTTPEGDEGKNLFACLEG